jgi:hypothetical protein
MSQADNVALLQQQLRTSHLRHAGKPWANGWDNAFRLWRRHYEARAALADQNPTFAAKLLPNIAPVGSGLPGLPVVPAGIRWAVDARTPNTLSVAVDIAGTISITVQPPNKAAALTPTIIAGATRQRTTFPAVADGIYKLTVTSGGAVLATLFVPVQRKRFLAFRELSRVLAFDFTANKTPAEYDTYCEMLALLYSAEAAAATGQLDAYYEIVALADALKKAPSPIALFPRG